MPSLGVNDRLFLAVDAPTVPQHVAALGTLVPPAGAGPGYVAGLAGRLRAEPRFAPPFNYRLANPALRTSLPSWKVLGDSAIDIDRHFHLHRLPGPHRERAFAELVGSLHEQRLDWERPLWEFHLIDGLPDGRFAFYFKVHHALMDGTGGAGRISRMLSTDPADATLRPLWAIGPARRESDAAPAHASVVDRVRGAVGWLAPASVVSRAFGAVGWSAAAACTTAEFAVAHNDLRRSARSPDDPARTGPYGGPMTIINGRLTAARRIATQPIALRRVKQAAKTAGVSVNEVFLTIVGGALRHYLDDLGALPGQSLIAGVPVSVRAAGDDAAGNAVSTVTMKLFTDIADPAQRIKAVQRSSQLAKQDIQSRSPAVAANYGALMLGGFILHQFTGWAGRTKPPCNVTVSCVPGPAATHYLAGAELEGLYPLAVLYHGVGLFIASFTISGTFGVGFLGCPDTIPHLQRLAGYTADAMAELERALGIG